MQKMELATSPASYQSDVLNHAVQCHGETLHAHILSTSQSHVKDILLYVKDKADILLLYPP